MKKLQQTLMHFILKFVSLHVTEHKLYRW